MLRWYSSIVPVEIKMVILCKADNEINSRVLKRHMDARMSGTVFERKLQKRQLPTAENQFLDGSCVELDPLSDLGQLIGARELERGDLLAVMVDCDSNGAQPRVFVIGLVGNKESVHLELFAADEIEGGVHETLEAVAE